jgi:2'-hydroxyisoflavone reductase
VIDNSASRSDAPHVGERLGQRLLRDAADQYLFISTRSVYRDLSMVPATVDAPLLTPETTPNWSEGRPYPYGLAKALAEAEARAAFGDRTTIVRPGLIVGPGDETDRFTYWPVRIDRGGEVLAPGDPHGPRAGHRRARPLRLVRPPVRAAHDGTFMGIGPRTAGPWPSCSTALRP